MNSLDHLLICLWCHPFGKKKSYIDLEILYSFDDIFIIVPTDIQGIDIITLLISNYKCLTQSSSLSPSHLCLYFCVSLCMCLRMLCVCVCVCVCARARTCACVRMSVESQSESQTACLVSKLKWSVCLLFTNTGITSLFQHTCLLTWVTGINLKSSCLQGQHFAYI